MAHEAVKVPHEAEKVPYEGAKVPHEGVGCKTTTGRNPPIYAASARSGEVL